MTKASDNKFPGIILNEAANDGSDFPNPDADYRRLFLGEDGMMHVKDSAGAVTAPYAGASEITDIATAEMDDSLVLAPDGAGGVEFRAEAGGGADLVQVASGAGSVRIPWLAGSPDIPVSGTGDHEFDASLTDGFAIGSPDIITANTIPSHLHIQKTTTGTFALHGRGWTLAELGISVPFTMTVKLTDFMSNVSYRSANVGVAEASPGKILAFGMNSANGFGPLYGNVGYAIWTNPTTRGTWGGDEHRYVGLPSYWRFIVASSTNITLQYSTTGFVFTTIHSSLNPSFTVGAVVIVITGQDNSVTAEAVFDWMRFT